MRTLSSKARSCNDCHICGHIHLSALRPYSKCPSSNIGCRGCDMVTKVEQDIEETMGKLNELIADLQRAKSEMNDCHSTIIKKLPTEIVSTIFEECVASSIDLENSDKISQADVLPIPLKLSQVCKSWSLVASSTPKMWTTMVISLGLCYNTSRVELLEQWMARTKGLPLDVSMCVRILEKSLPPRFQREIHTIDPDEIADPDEIYMMDVLVATSKQWRNVHLQLPYVALEALFCTLKNIPNVSYFRVELTDRRSDDKIQTDRESCPWTNFQISPKHVILAGPDLPFNAINIRWDTVETARLTGFYDTECLDLLRSSPMLLSVMLEDIWEKDDSEIDASSQDYSSIQHLGIQHLSYVSYIGYMCVLRCLKLPRLTSLVFNASLSDVDALGDFFADSVFSLERLEMIDYSFDHLFIVQLLQAVPSLQHLRLKALSWNNTSEKSPAHLLRHLAETSKRNVFLPNLKTLEYDVGGDDMIFPWELVPAIFGPEDRNMHPPLTSFKLIHELKARTTHWQIHEFLIPQKVLRQLLTLRQNGAQIIYKTAEGVDLFNMSIGVARINKNA